MAAGSRGSDQLPRKHALRTTGPLAQGGGCSQQQAMTSTAQTQLGWGAVRKCMASQTDVKPQWGLWGCHHGLGPAGSMATLLLMHPLSQALGSRARAKAHPPDYHTGAAQL